MIDIHSHIIPGIDDGAKDMEMTLEMLRNAEKDGTKEIIATPHYLFEYGESTIKEIKVVVEEINYVVNKEGINIKIYSGQEVYFTKNIIGDYIQGNIGTLNDSRYMLIEFPMQKFDENIFNTLYELQIRDIVIVIAHPERYKFFIQKPALINDFIDEGYLFQMNSGSLEGKFGEKPKKIAKLFLENNIYNFIGSDAHNIKSRNTGLNKAMNLLNENYRNNEEINQCIFNDSSKKLIKNESIKFVGKKIIVKRNIFSFL